MKVAECRIVETKKGETKMQDYIFIENLDAETPLSIQGPLLRFDWYNAGEGWYGDYDPDDPTDANLLRFDGYIKNDIGEWEELEDSSYCTRTRADTTMDWLKDLLHIIYKRYSDVVTEYPCCISVKKLGEELSWISP